MEIRLNYLCNGISQAQFGVRMYFLLISDEIRPFRKYEKFRGSKLKFWSNPLLTTAAALPSATEAPLTNFAIFHIFWDLNGILNFQNDVVLIILGLWANEGLFLIQITSPTHL